MKVKIREIAELIGGEVIGDEKLEITYPAKIEDAEKGTISFISNLKYLPYLDQTQASAILVPSDLEIEDPQSDITLIKVKDPYAGFSEILHLFAANKNIPSGISSWAYISDSAEIAADVFIGPFAEIGEGAKIGQGSKIYGGCHVGENVKIGKNTILYNGVQIYNDTVIGDDCVLHSGVVVGSDGFGFAPLSGGTYNKIPQLGNVIIKNKVEVGALSTIDRATLGSTTIHDGVKLDNQIQVAHNVEIGENTVIASQTGISGSTKIGRNCIVGGQVGFVGHLNIADGTRINAQSGITKSIDESNTQWSGSPAIEFNKSQRANVIFRNLPQLWDKISKIEKYLNINKKEK